MFERILLSSDGSNCALRACAYAAAIAGRCNSSVTLLDVFSMLYMDSAYMGAWSLTVDVEQVQDLAAQHHQTVVCHSGPILQAEGVKYRAIQEQGYPIGVILDTAAREQSNLIVMGSRGLSGVKSFLIGSVSSGVLHHAPCSVLIVHGESIPIGTPEIKTILLASDGSACAAAAADAAVDMAHAFNAKLAVVNVIPDPASPHSIVWRHAIPDADRKALIANMFEHVEASVRSRAVSAGVPHTILQKTGNPAEVILRTATDIGADMIVVGSRGLGGFKSMLLGSVSDRVVRGSECPVLVVR